MKGKGVGAGTAGRTPMAGRLTIACRALAVAVVFVCLAVPAGVRAADDSAAGGGAVAAAWRALTTTDVEAAHALLLGNDPATVPGVDAPFVATLEAAYSHALAQARTVTSYPGYVATLGEFANSMNDGHIWSRPRYAEVGLEFAGIEFRPPSIHWAGLIVAKRGSEWIIAREDATVVSESLAGARLTECDGQAIDDFARETLGRYRVVWSVEAMQVLAAPWLLVDEDNPFIKRPDSCTVRTATGVAKITLNWKRVSREKFLGLISDGHGHAGFGIRAVGPGYWIGLESLSGKAPTVIDAAKTQEDKLRAAPFVVIDLRGNSGGADSYGRDLADVLYGPAYTRAVLGPPEEESGGCPEAWRASPENIAAVEDMAKKFAAAGETQPAKDSGAAAAAMRAALEQHRALTAPLVCARSRSRPLAPARSLMPGRVIVLTDSVCFSSCINTVGFFRKLKATLAGQTTGADTHYSEVREIPLPSGLSTFSTLQSIDPAQPLHIGPYVPDFPYGGDISDTAGVEKWVRETVVRAL